MLDKLEYHGYTIEELNLDIDILRTFWDNAKKHRTLFNREIRNDFTNFCSLFLEGDSVETLRPKGLFWKVSTNDNPFLGILYITRIEIGLDAMVHFSFFDSKLGDRANLLKYMCRHIMLKYGFRRLTAEIPDYGGRPRISYTNTQISKTTSRLRYDIFYYKRSPDEAKGKLMRKVVKFAESIGFKFEGYRRDCVPYDGKYHNAFVYGLLLEDINNGE